MLRGKDESISTYFPFNFVIFSTICTYSTPCRGLHGQVFFEDGVKKLNQVWSNFWRLSRDPRSTLTWGWMKNFGAMLQVILYLHTYTVVRTYHGAAGGTNHLHTWTPFLLSKASFFQFLSCCNTKRVKIYAEDEPFTHKYSLTHSPKVESVAYSTFNVCSE